MVSKKFYLERMKNAGKLLNYHIEQTSMLRKALISYSNELNKIEKRQRQSKEQGGN